MHIKDFLDKSRIPFEEKVLLSKRTWIQTGGICTYWISPISVTQLTEVCRFLYVNNIPFDLIGQTSNIFFHSSYNPEVVVSTIRVNEYHIEDNVLICDCGVSVIKLSKVCIAAGYTGFHGLVGLPGTVASAAANNSGCFNCSISSMMIGADILMPDGTVKTFTKDDFGYKKRSSRFKRGEMKGVILSLRLCLNKSKDIAEEYQRSEIVRDYRKRRQEGYRHNLGSVFAAKKQNTNIRNIIALVVAELLCLFHIANLTQARKQMLLWLYGYRNLDRYVSNRNLNIFVWRDENAEKMFDEYKHFMSKVYRNLELEIEEKK